MAKQNRIIDIDEIKKNLNTAIENVALEVGNEIQNAFELSISKFYSSYYPRRYDRTENLLNASSAANGVPVYEVIGDLSCRAGITVDSEYMPSYPSKSHGWRQPDKNQIFPRAWEEGIHGFAQGEDFGLGMSRIHGQTYFYDRDRGAPPKTNPPKQKMEKEFNRIVKSIGRRIDSTFTI